MFKLYPTLFTLLLSTILCTCVSAQTAELVFPDNIDQYENFNSLYIAPEGRGFATGQCGSLLRTTNDGASFQSLPPLLNNISYSKVSCLPATNCQTVFLTTNRGVYRSTDAGSTWRQVSSRNFSKYNYELDGHLFGYTYRRTQLLHSTDDGATWTELSLPVDMYSELYPVSSTEWYYYGENKLFKTTDAGLNWETAFTFPTTNNINGGFRDDNGNFYASFGPDFYESTDDGNNFTLQSSTQRLYSTISEIWRGQGDSIHIISFRGFRFSTVDNGVNWINTPPTTFQSYNSYTRAEGRFFAAAEGLTLVTADDDWLDQKLLLTEKVPEFDNIQFTDEQSAYAYETQTGDVYKSENGGATWAVTANLGSSTEGRLKVTNNKHVYAFGREFTLQRSEDGARTFEEPRFVRQAGINGTRVAFSPLPGGGIIALISGKTVRSDGNSITAEYTNSIDINGGSWDMTMITDDFGFVHRTPREPFYRTVDGGANWQEVASPGTSGLFFSYFYFADANNGYVGGGNNLTHRTADGGLTWTQAPSLSRTYGIFKVADDLFAIDGQTLYRSVDNGEFWDREDEINCSGINLATIQPGTDKIFYTMLGAIGSFDPQEILSPVEEISALQGNLRVIPNPSSGAFQLDLPANGIDLTQVSVFDLTGRQILTKQLGENAAAEVDLTGRPAGVYVARVRSSDGKILTTRLVKR